MRASASRENAQRLLTTLRRAAARVEARDLAIVFRRVAAVLFFLELVYLCVGNALLQSSAIQRAVAGADGFHLDFARAYTLWPGHVKVRDLSLRVEDYNVQFEIALADADADIALSQLFFKKFRMTKLRAAGVRFRMRHKLIAIGDDAERVAAYPPIRGFADPPYYVGVHPPGIPDSKYDLWQVRIENVEARVSELWVMEYRFRGSGVARGSFVVKPARWVQVEPATLDFEQGRLTLGQHLVAERMRGRITCDIPDMHVQETHGLEVLRDILAGAQLELSGGKVDFLRAYLARWGSARYAGSADWRLDVHVLRGVVTPGSRISVHAAPFELRHEMGALFGNLDAALERPAAQLGHPPENELALTFAAPHVAIEKAARGGAAPSLSGVKGSLALHAVDLKREPRLGAASLTVQEARVPDLGWFSTQRLRLRGSARAGLELRRSETSAVSGTARLRATGVELAHDELTASGAVQGEVAFSRAAPQPLEVQKLMLSISDARISRGQKSTRPFALSLDAAGLRVFGGSEARASGELRLHLSSSQALLPLVLGNPIKGLASSALDLQALDGRASVALSRRALRLEHIDARSGKLRVRGHLNQSSSEPSGAFLFSSWLFNVGVTLEEGEAEVSPFVADDWLAADVR
jgi:hypothetical protein